MIKVLKVGNYVYQNIDVILTTEDGTAVRNLLIPEDPEQLKSCIADTLGWIVGKNILKVVGDVNKKDASTTKAVVLLAKLIRTINPDTSVLTENERSAYQKLLSLADVGYSDSTLLNNALDAVVNQLQWYAEKLSQLDAIDVSTPDAFDKLINFAESL